MSLKFESTYKKTDKNTLPGGYRGLLQKIETKKAKKKVRSLLHRAAIRNTGEIGVDIRVGASNREGQGHTEGTAWQKAEGAGAHGVRQDTRNVR